MRIAISAALIGLCIAGANAAADVRASVREPIEIPAQQLGSALRMLAGARGFQLIYLSDAIENLPSDGLKGNLTTAEALTQLLSRNGLSFKYVDENTVSVFPAHDAKNTATAVHTSSAAGDSTGENSASRTSDLGKVQLARVADQGETKAETAASQAGETSATREGAQTEVVVTGTHIRGITETAAPSITITRDDIEKTGYTKVEDIFRDLPQNLAEFRPGGNWSDGSSTPAKQNVQSVSSVSLRGLGAGSTLTLVNGERRAPGLQGRAIDVSAIPLSMVERVEIVTGGASAVYGSDAVAGVVNLITRRAFEGMETQFSVSDSSHPGGERMQVSHVMGSTFDRGGFAIGYDYSRDKNLDLLDTGVARFPSPSGTTVYHSTLLPKLERHSMMLSGKFDVSERVELYADGLYTRNENENFYQASYAPGSTYYQQYGTRNNGYSGALGVRSDITAAWELDVSAVRAVSQANYHSPAGEVDDVTGEEFYFSDGYERDETTLTTASAVFEGPLSWLALKGSTPRAALGADWRKEEFDNPSWSNSGGSSNAIIGDRTVRSAFAELSLPIATDGRAGLRRLEFSLGSRYDRYSDFGSTVNHQGGIIWQPAETLTVRGTYATAYRAPELWYLYGSHRLNLQTAQDPVTGGNSVLLYRSGNGNPSLTAEEATTWSASLDWKPAFAPWAKFSLSYFNIDYTDRIDRPIDNSTTVLVNEAKFVDLIDRQPTAAQLQAILDQPYPAGLRNFTGVPYNPATGAAGLLSAFPNIILVDGRTTNLAVETVRGVDFQVDANFEIARGELSLGFNSTYSLDHERSITPTSPSIDMLNRVGKPVDLRVRATTGWTQGAFGAFLGINYIDRYMDDLATTPTKMDAWTTVDVSLRLMGSQLSGAAFLQGITLSLSADNLLDEAPPELLSDNEGLGYDAANAHALGRIISLRVQKRW